MIHWSPPFDDGDFVIGIEVEVEGFRGRAAEVVIGAEFLDFTRNLALLEKERSGSVTLNSAAGLEWPGDAFRVTIKSVDALGHFAAEGVLKHGGSQEGVSQELRFTFGFDPSNLVSAVGELSAAEKAGWPKDE